MEVTNSSAASSVLFDQSASNQISSATRNNALDRQAQSAAEAVKAPPEPEKTPLSSNLPSHLGQNVNTTA